MKSAGIESRGIQPGDWRTIMVDGLGLWLILIPPRVPRKQVRARRIEPRPAGEEKLSILGKFLIVSLGAKRVVPIDGRLEHPRLDLHLTRKFFYRIRAEEFRRIESEKALHLFIRSLSLQPGGTACPIPGRHPSP